MVHELNDKSRLEGRGVVAVFARYVDDMVLIAPNPRELERLRILVQNQLAQRGLELSKKTEPLPPMTRAEVRQWLTDRRGGLGVSGPFAGPPANWALAALGPLAGAGDFDRSDSLSMGAVTLRTEDLAGKRGIRACKPRELPVGMGCKNVGASDIRVARLRS